MARSTTKAPKTTDRLATTVKPLRQGPLGDLGSRQLRGLAAQQGNQALDARLQALTGTRDGLLTFIGSRLKTMHTVQGFEKLEMKDERKWFKAVSKGKVGYHLPDPTRWHTAAGLYRQASDAMCNGNLSHGGALLDRAIEAERAAYDSTPEMVREHLDHTNDQAADAPVELAHVGSQAACVSCAPPAELRYADLILNVTDKPERSPPAGGPKRHAWWVDEEEDEEEDEADE